MIKQLLILAIFLIFGNFAFCEEVLNSEDLNNENNVKSTNLVYDIAMFLGIIAIFWLINKNGGGTGGSFTPSLETSIASNTTIVSNLDVNTIVSSVQETQKVSVAVQTDTPRYFAEHTEHIKNLVTQSNHLREHMLSTNIRNPRIVEHIQALSEANITLSNVSDIQCYVIDQLRAQYNITDEQYIRMLYNRK